MRPIVDTERLEHPLAIETEQGEPEVRQEIVVEEITKRYGQRTALESISIQVPPGSVLALLGPNGAGKTTLVRVLTTLIRPDRGRAFVAGHDVVTDAARVRSAIGLVGQHAAVDEFLTGRENLLLVARLLRFDKSTMQRQVQETLERFALTDVADAPSATYSGGLRRRLDLATTLLAKPAAIFLDEPTTGLDPASRRELWALIQELVVEGTTVLLTTQYLEEADRLADTVAVIDRGRMIATGTPDHLKARLSGDTVHIRLADPTALPDAVAALGETRVISAVDGDESTIELRAPNGAAVLPEALRDLNDRDVTVIAAELQRPGLDDVFLALTGQRAARHPDNAEGAPSSSRPAHRHGTRSHA